MGPEGLPVGPKGLPVGPEGVIGVLGPSGGINVWTYIYSFPVCYKTSSPLGAAAQKE